jgi:hypothetical protein
MSNYVLSLERKRKKFELRRHSVNENFEKKMTKENLQKLIWAMPIVKIAKNYKVHHRNITEYCKKWGISIPPLGYWNRKKFIDNNNKNK